jgi:adenylate cyclase
MSIASPLGTAWNANSPPYSALTFTATRLMGEDEEATLRKLTSHRKLIDSAIEQHHGRFVNSPGDSVLAEFASAVEAVDCALISRAYSNLNGSVPTEPAVLPLL